MLCVSCQLLGPLLVYEFLGPWLPGGLLGCAEPVGVVVAAPSHPAVTASEAGQQKRLLLLDTDWQQLGSIPISIGRKYFSLATPAAATNAAVSTSHTIPPSAAATAGGEDPAAANLTPDRSSSSAGSESDQDPMLGLPATEAAGRGVLQLDVGHIQQLLAEGALQAGDLVHLRAEQDDSSEGDIAQVVKVLTDKGGLWWWWWCNAEGGWTRT